MLHELFLFVACLLVRLFARLLVSGSVRPAFFCVLYVLGVFCFFCFCIGPIVLKVAGLFVCLFVLFVCFVCLVCLFV